MAKLTREQMIEKVRTFVGERTDDDALSLIEDVNDSFVESENSALMERYNELNTKHTELQQKYDNLDKTWRDKYKARFYENVETKDDKEEISGDTISIDDLFNKKEG